MDTILTVDANRLPIKQNSESIDAGSEISRLQAGLQNSVDQFNYLQTIAAIPNLSPEISAILQPVLKAVAPLQPAITAALTPATEQTSEQIKLI